MGALNPARLEAFRERYREMPRGEVRAQPLLPCDWTYELHLAVLRCLVSPCKGGHDRGRLRTQGTLW